MNDSRYPKDPGRRLVVALLLLVMAAGPALAVDGVIEFNQASTGGSFFITASGSYRLTSNLTTPAGIDGIHITADHVTLDLNGFTIASLGGSLTDGIFAGAQDIEIRNGTVASFTRHGIFSNAASNFVRLIGVRVIGNTFSGLELQGVGNIVDGCTSEGNGTTGIRVGEGSLIVNSVARQNGTLGLVMAATAGYRSNVVTMNNGGNANPQTTANGIQLGSNVCATDLVCP